MVTFVFGQTRNPIKGKLLYKNTNVVAANVVNNTDQTNTITNEDGEFEIDVAVGDKVIFSSLQFQIRSVVITEEIIRKNRLVVTVNENINELKEVVVTPEDIEKFLDLKEEEFKGFDYERDKSSEIEAVSSSSSIFPSSSMLFSFLSSSTATTPPFSSSSCTATSRFLLSSDVQW